MDLATLIGIVAGIATIFGVITHLTDVSNFIHLPGMVVVLGGTLSAVLVTFSLADLKKVLVASTTALFQSNHDMNELLQIMIEIGRQRQASGERSLEKMVKGEYPELVNRAIEQASESMDAEEVKRQLHEEVEFVTSRNMVVVELLRKMALFAPAFGMIGTVIGLIAMLGQMENPSEVGPAMALALTTTLYGTLLATLFLSPAAVKLEKKTSRTVINLEIVYTALVGVIRNERPRTLYEQASVLIPADERMEFQAKAK